MLQTGILSDNPRTRVLVVEADALHRMMMCRVAAVAGCAPAGAVSYNEAVRLLAAGSFALIVLVVTPGLSISGDVLYHLSATGCRAGIIIVGDGDETAREGSAALARALKLNLLDVMQKPIDPTKLQGWLEQLEAKDAAASAAA